MRDGNYYVSWACKCCKERQQRHLGKYELTDEDITFTFQYIPELKLSSVDSWLDFIKKMKGKIESEDDDTIGIQEFKRILKLCVTEDANDYDADEAFNDGKFCFLMWDFC